MQIQDIRLLYDYNDWATQRILSVAAHLSQEQFVTPSIHGQSSLRHTLVHTLDTEYSWRTLCQHHTFAEDLREEDFPTLDSIVKRWRDEEAALRDYLNSLRDDDLTKIVRYTINDRTRERVLWHCLVHVVNHGTQHRSEAGVILTSYGQSPGDLDFTVFLRQLQ